MNYQRKRYRAMNEGPKMFDFFKQKVTDGTKNIVGGAANAAGQQVSNAFKGVKLPDVNVAMSPATTKLVKNAVMGISATAIAVALIVRGRK